MISVHVRINGNLPSANRIQDGLARGMKLGLARIENRLKTVEFRGTRGPNRVLRVRFPGRKLASGKRAKGTWRDVQLRSGAVGNALAVRTGAARASIRSNVYEYGGVVTGVIGSPLKYVRFHEFGGTITGKPWLYIPTGLKFPKVIRKKSVTQRPRKMFETAERATRSEVAAIFSEQIRRAIR